jgi:hypothetical protein
VDECKPLVPGYTHPVADYHLEDILTFVGYGGGGGGGGSGSKVASAGPGRYCPPPHRHALCIGRFRYIASRAERRRFARSSVLAFILTPAFPRGALTLCPQLCMGISARRYTEFGLSSFLESSGILSRGDKKVAGPRRRQTPTGTKAGGYTRPLFGST